MASAPNGKKENILTSWKEIAAYLDHDVRTCVRWEQRYGLPIHRLDRDSKGKVFAYKEQIDGWLAARAAGGASRPEGVGKRPGLLRAFPLVFALAGLAAAAYFLFLKPGSGAVTAAPADFSISGARFVVLDGKARELWSFDTRLADLETGDFYHEHFQEKGTSPDYAPVWPLLMIRDLDGDARSEVLFSTQTKSEDREGTLVCFDERGGERWRFEAGRELRFGGHAYRKEYRIYGINVDDYDGDGALEVLVLSFHKPDWPCQAVVLDAAGKLEGEYWNAGYLMDGQMGDVDGDGAKELVLSGVNNEYARGCVIVFEAGVLRGGSPQREAGYRWPDDGAGSESAYILFPKTDVHEAIRREGDPINYFWIHDGDGLTAVTSETQIYFDLDRTLACRDVTLSNYFMNRHREFRLAGKVRSLPDDAYKSRIGEAILYHENGDWSSRPIRTTVLRRTGPAHSSE